jgi:hypothetical protein
LGLFSISACAHLPIWEQNWSSSKNRTLPDSRAAPKMSALCQTFCPNRFRIKSSLVCFLIFSGTYAYCRNLKPGSA